MERLQKVIAQSGIVSRRKAEELIQLGRVKVNGEVVTALGTKVSNEDFIEVDGVPLVREEKIYLLMNKPRGVISSTKDEKQRKTVISILPEEYQKYRLFPVGRLDYDTKGVILLTNDGELMNRLIGPQSNVEKEYLARVDGIINSKSIN
ncbi:MAG TPA: pseudouridine synthase, partial [Bacilli bacterium]|nr:pseudouridine synthase [Bacilli bacterium]